MFGSLQFFYKIAKYKSILDEIQKCHSRFLNLSLIATTAEVTTKFNLQNHMHELHRLSSCFCRHGSFERFY